MRKHVLKHSKLKINPMDELIVDNFAGGGGASYGIEQAFGRSVDIAIDHDAAAIAMHKANHPDTLHYTESVWDVDPRKATHGTPVGLAWFSPDCKHFSKAKGGKPVEKNIRGLAWVVIRWAAAVRPRVIMLENVEEFQTWGPLDSDNKPCQIRKGHTFRRWKQRLEELGYCVDARELRACDYGAPTIRNRLFIIARCDGRQIVWPEPTHGEGLLPYRTAAECIDFKIPCPSIFERKRPLVENTMKRIARGIQRYVIDNPEPFIVKPNHTASYYDCFRGQSLNEPMQTITQVNDRALVSPYIIKHFGGATGADARDPLPTILARNTQNQLLAVNLMREMGQSVGQGVDKPAQTVMPGGLGKTKLIPSHIAKLRGTNIGSKTDEPLHTVSAQGLHHAEVRAFLIKYYGNGRNGCNLKEPIHTITAKERFGIVTVHGEEYQIVDIGMRMLQPRELYRAQGFPDSYIIDPEFNGKPMTKTNQVRMCGNSVCPPVAESIVRANVCIDAKQRMQA